MLNWTKSVRQYIVYLLRFAKSFFIQSFCTVSTEACKLYLIFTGIDSKLMVLWEYCVLKSKALRKKIQRLDVVIRSFIICLSIYLVVYLVLHSYFKFNNSLLMAPMKSFKKDFFAAAGHIGTLLIGFVGLRGINAFINERKKRRSDAAGMILAKILQYMDKVGDVVEFYDLYQCPGYENGMWVDRTKIEPDLGRPLSLIKGENLQLKLVLYEPAVCLSLDSKSKLLKVIDEVTSKGLDAAYAISAKLKQDAHSLRFDEKLAQRNDEIVSSFPQTAQSLIRKVESILNPIIENGE